MWQWNIHSPGRSSNVTSSRIVVFIGTLTVSFHPSGPIGWPFSSTSWKKKPWRWNGWSQSESFLTIHNCFSPSFARYGLAFQNGTPLTWNSDLLFFIGGSVNTMSTGVAPSTDGTGIARVTVTGFAAIGVSLVNSIVNTSSTARYST